MLCLRHRFVLLFLQLLSIGSPGQTSPSCKASPGCPSWPSQSKWHALNSSISGRLLQPTPPGAVCHPGQPTYNNATCAKVAAEWLTVDFYAEDPISNAWPNWNNDSCLPFLPSPCSGGGFPIYAVNATGVEDIKKGIDFAREHNVRLVVKATGHDYLGRSTAPNSLTLWVHNIKGITVHKSSFKPQACRNSIKTAAISFGAGIQMGEINQIANASGLTVVSGGQHGVSYGGFGSGGGHSALGPTFGMAADNILELEIVSPSGDVLTVNECQNQDLFWAMRGGGGSTFGVITSTTIAAWPSFPFIGYNVTIGTLPNSESFWDSMSYIFSQYPVLAEFGLSGYGSLSPNTSVFGSFFGGFEGIFFLPVLSPQNTTASLVAAIDPIIEHINATWPGFFEFILTPPVVYPSFYDWWLPFNAPDYGGIDFLVGSRLLPAEALTANLTAVKVALQGFNPVGTSGLSVDFVSGKGVWNAKPRGGSDSVNPAWRKAVIHLTNAVEWSYLDPVGKAEQQDFLTNTYVEALRVLAPDSGAYANEADPNEPNPHQAFWGSNYPRLLDIKRGYDPDDVFWCTPCVGNERWKEVGNDLCRVQ